MHRHPNTKRLHRVPAGIRAIGAWAIGLVALAGSLLPAACHASETAALRVSHELSVELIPSAHRLVGRDRMSIRVDDRRKLVFALSERSLRVRVEVEGRPRAFKFSNSELEIPLEPDERRRTLEVVIAYEAEFNDAVPVQPLNTDNPGFGVTASISEAGTFLLPGAGWYPDLVDGQDTFLLKVKAPEGVLAVTAGLSLGHTVRDGQTLSEWRIDHPVRGLALSAAAYQVLEQKVGAVVAAAYFRSENQDLAPAYLEATARYLNLYSERFGAYPFPKFAVVENFFPTGFGFPSYTLLGSTVLRLPFILSTSLGHEIAHCWWGNGVYVDYESGNWSEGLTTYVSDYLYSEMQSAAEARNYRLQALRNYATLVPPAKDFPLLRFMSRTDTITKAVGYDKAAMVFHMLRRLVGEDAFWGALRDVYRDRLFQATSWDDFRQAFEKRSGTVLLGFFEQWVNRKGAPRIRLEAVRKEPLGDGWSVTGRLEQEKPFFSTDFELALETDGGRMTQPLRLFEGSARFEFMSTSAPKQLDVDPDCHSLRRLDPAEIPPTVNSLKSSASVAVVVCSPVSGSGGRLAEILVRSLGIRSFTIAAENDLDPGSLDGRDVIFVGLPRDRSLLAAAPSGLQVAEAGFSLEGSIAPADGDTFFGVWTQANHPMRVVAVFLPGPPTAAESAAAKITHYGRFSYLAFREGQNRTKGSWTMIRSPVVHRWD